MHKLAGLGLAAALVLADQATKALALRHLDPIEPIIVTPFFNLVLVWNRGVSFGLLTGTGQDSPWLLVLLATGIATLLVFWLWRERRTMAQLALWLVLAGALGNVIDRVRFGAVVDFLDFHLAGHHWPAFNVADSAIVIGAGLLLVDSLLAGRRSTNQGAGERDARA
jgi:signal peptidase II